MITPERKLEEPEEELCEYCGEDTCGNGKICKPCLEEQKADFNRD